MSKWTYMNIKGQGHSLTLVKDHSDPTFSNFFSLGTARPIEAKLHVDPPCDRGTKVCSNGPGHMTKMATMYMVKTLKNLLLWNQKADDLESWYAASGTVVVYDIKVGRCSQLNEYMKLYEYQRSRSFIDLGPNLSDSIFLNFFSSITTRLIEAKFHVQPRWDGGGGTNACSNDPDHMIKMAAMPIYGKNLLKSSLELKLWWPWNLVCSI